MCSSHLSAKTIPSGGTRKAAATRGVLHDEEDWMGIRNDVGFVEVLAACGGTPSTVLLEVELYTERI